MLGGRRRRSLGGALVAVVLGMGCGGDPGMQGPSVEPGPAPVKPVSYCPETVTLGPCETGVSAQPEPGLCLQHEVTACAQEADGAEAMASCLHDALAGRVQADGLDAILRCARNGKTPLPCAPSCQRPNNNKILIGGRDFATKAACETDRDNIYSRVADSQLDDCRAFFTCGDPCPNLRLGEPDVDKLCACTQDPKAEDPKLPWRYFCELTAQFQCCCTLEI